jgi:hypothetical protein
MVKRNIYSPSVFRLRRIYPKAWFVSYKIDLRPLQFNDVRLTLTRQQGKQNKISLVYRKFLQQSFHLFWRDKTDAAFWLSKDVAAS